MAIEHLSWYFACSASKPDEVSSVDMYEPRECAANNGIFRAGFARARKQSVDRIVENAFQRQSFDFAREL
jgi:hypothetical protein